jgi:hypothetical protein
MRAAVAKLAKQMPGVALSTLAHHIDPDWLHEAYRRTRKDGAVGVDGQTAAEYAAHLEENLRSLLDRAKCGDRSCARSIDRLTAGTAPLFSRSPRAALAPISRSSCTARTCEWPTCSPRTRRSGSCSRSPTSGPDVAGAVPPHLAGRAPFSPPSTQSGKRAPLTNLWAWVPGVGSQPPGLSGLSARRRPSGSRSNSVSQIRRRRSAVDPVGPGRGGITSAAVSPTSQRPGSTSPQRSALDSRPTDSLEEPGNGVAPLQTLHCGRGVVARDPNLVTERSV